MFAKILISLDELDHEIEVHEALIGQLELRNVEICVTVSLLHLAKNVGRF